jgi:hypothetical protein
MEEVPLKGGESIEQYKVPLRGEESEGDHLKGREVAYAFHKKTGRP